MNQSNYSYNPSLYSAICPSSQFIFLDTFCWDCLYKQIVRTCVHIIGTMRMPPMRLMLPKLMHVVVSRVISGLYVSIIFKGVCCHKVLADCGLTYHCYLLCFIFSRPWFLPSVLLLKLCFIFIAESFHKLLWFGRKKKIKRGRIRRNFYSKMLQFVVLRFINILSHRTVGDFGILLICMNLF